MRFERDGFSVESAINKKRKLPEWYLDKPPEGSLDEFYLNGFWNLDTTRRIEGGQIPWDIIVEYGYHAGFDPGMVKVFVQVIREMDKGYLVKWRPGEIERARKASK